MRYQRIWKRVLRSGQLCPVRGAFDLSARKSLITLLVTALGKWRWGSHNRVGGRVNRKVRVDSTCKANSVRKLGLFGETRW